MSDGQEVLIQGFGHGLLAPGLMKFCSFGEDDTGRLHPVVQVAGDAVWLGRLLLWQLGTVGALGCLLLLKKKPYPGNGIRQILNHALGPPATI